LEDRLQIADLHLAGSGVRSIAAQLGRSPSTVSRELRRNGLPPRPRARGTATYAPYAAQKRAELRARRPKAGKFDNPELASMVQAKLCLKWSPEQISDHLAAVVPDRQELQVSPETIHSTHLGQTGYFSGSRFGIHVLPRRATAGTPSMALRMMSSFLT